jgi:hypothetical protein
MGNSYTTLPPLSLMNLIATHWDERTPGHGETGLDRKVLVPVPATDNNGRVVFFCPPRVKLVLGMPLRAHVVVRQAGEDPYIETFITPEDAANYDFLEQPATHVNIVCYSAAALEENNGKRTSRCEWEIVTVLCSEQGVERMTPLTMARNFLEKTGGTKGVYTAHEFAEAIWEASISRGVKVRKA